MMEDLCKELFPYSKQATVESEPIPEEKKVNTVTTISTNNINTIKCTRVLWDIENITPMTSNNTYYSKYISNDPPTTNSTTNTTTTTVNMTLKTIQLLNEFLERNKYAGNGINCHITTFINMIGSLTNRNSKSADSTSYTKIDQNVILDLDKANVEILFCSK